MTGIPNVLTHLKCLFKVRVFMELFTDQIQLGVWCISLENILKWKILVVSIIHLCLVTFGCKCTSNTERAKRLGLSLGFRRFPPLPSRSDLINLSRQTSAGKGDRYETYTLGFLLWPSPSVGRKLMLPSTCGGRHSHRSFLTAHLESRHLNQASVAHLRVSSVKEGNEWRLCVANTARCLITRALPRSACLCQPMRLPRPLDTNPLHPQSATVCHAGRGTRHKQILDELLTKLL